MTMTRAGAGLWARRIVASMAIASIVGAAGCSNDSTESGDTAWSYTTAYGNTITSDHRPDKVVVDTYSAGALWDYGVRPVGVFGFGLDEPGTMGNADRKAMAEVGVDATFSVEEAARVGTDLIVGYANPDKPAAWFSWQPNVADQAKNLAPFLGVSYGESIDSTLQQYRSIAKALGADTDTDQVKDAQKKYEDAKQQVRDAVAAKPGLTVLPLNVQVAQVYVGAENMALVQLIKSLGVNVVGPTDESAWATVAWENVAQHPADLVLEYVLSDESSLSSSPSYRSLPAVAAGQTLKWNDKRPATYLEYAGWLDQLADAINKAQKIT